MTGTLYFTNSHSGSQRGYFQDGVYAEKGEAAGISGLGGAEDGRASGICAVKPLAPAALRRNRGVACPVPEVFFIFLYMTGAPGYSPRVFQEGNDSFQL